MAIPDKNLLKTQQSLLIILRYSHVDFSKSVLLCDLYVYFECSLSLCPGIYECNKKCSCAKTCLNRVAQHPLRQKLQVFPPPPRYPVGSNLAPQSAARSDIKGSVSDPGFFPDPDQTFLIFLSPDPDRPNIRIRIREKNVHWSKSRIFFIYISYLL